MSQPVEPRRATLSPPRGRITGSFRFSGDLDERLLLERFPPEQRVKGMFCARFAAELESDWRMVERELRAPPLLGRYLPFHDYPLVDHLLLALRCAQKRFGPLGQREAIRRIARRDMETFLSSTLGRITSALLRTPAETLAALPGVYERVARGPRYQCERRGERAASMRLEHSFGPWEYVVGQLEGVVGHYAVEPTIECFQEGTARRFDLSW